MPGISTEWLRSRPVAPGYGIPESGGEMLDLDDVRARLESAPNYWIGSVSAAGHPHAVPVWAAFVKDALWFGAGPRTTRNLGANPRVTVHLDSANEVVILEGEVVRQEIPDPVISQAIDDQYQRKYDWRPSSESDEPVGTGWYSLDPTRIIAWTRFPADATRWTRRSAAGTPTVSGRKGTDA